VRLSDKAYSYCLVRYLDTYPKNDVISFFRKGFVAFRLG